MRIGSPQSRLSATVFLSLIFISALIHMGAPSVVSADDGGGIILPPPRVPSQGLDSTATTDTLNVAADTGETVIASMLKVVWDFVLNFL